MKKILQIGAIIILLLIINGLARSIYDLWNKQDLLTLAKKTLEEEKLKNKKLKGELSYVESPEFIEREARNKLFLVKPGEKEILISQKSSQEAKLKKEVNIPNWKKWLNLFF